MGNIAELKHQRYLMLGMVSELTPEQQAEIQKARSEMAALISGYGDIGKIAASLAILDVGIEIGG